MHRWILVALAALIAAGVALRYHADPASAQQRTPVGDSRQVILGREIFRDPTISDDGRISCASCHIPANSYSDNKPVSVGVYGRVGTRNAPSLSQINAISSDTFFWDGRRQVLSQAVLDPMTNPVEMGLHNSSQLVQRVRANPHYVSAFKSAFGDSSVSEIQIAEVLAAFIRSIPTKESAYDRYAMHNDATALDPRAKLGLDLFNGKAHCAECHSLKASPATLTDNSYHRGGVGMDSIQQDLATLTASVIGRSLQGADVGTRVATHAGEAQLGRFNVTLDPADIGLFRTPSLRDVSRTAPYMHDGSVPTLEDAIDREVYYRGLQDGRPLNVTVEDRRDLKAFLEKL
jgi:cytochrome c peroxidase